LYLVTAQGSAGYIWLAKSIDDGVSWSTANILGSGNAWGDWDPFIAKLPNGNLLITWCPTLGSDAQQIKSATSADDGVNWSSAIDLTSGHFGSNEWWDYWPQVLVDGDKVQIYYTTEHNSNGLEKTGGNIWMFEYGEFVAKTDGIANSSNAPGKSLTEALNDIIARIETLEP